MRIKRKGTLSTAGLVHKVYYNSQQQVIQLSTRGRAVRKRASHLLLTLRIVTFEEGDFLVLFQPVPVCPSPFNCKQ